MLSLISAATAGTEAAMADVPFRAKPTLDDILQTDRAAREAVLRRAE